MSLTNKMSSSFRLSKPRRHLLKFQNSSDISGKTFLIEKHEQSRDALEDSFRKFSYGDILEEQIKLEMTTLYPSILFL